MNELRLHAEDAEDLAVISAALQDAVAKVADLAFLPSTRRFAMMVNRFRWEEAKSRNEGGARARAGLHFEHVLSAQARNIAQGRPDGVLNLLAVRYEELNPPSGIVTLVFSGVANCALRLKRWRSISPIWA